MIRKQLFAQVWELVRFQPLLTCISVLGTAFAITMIMVIVIVWQTKYADLAPEVNRSREFRYLSTAPLREPRPMSTENTPWTCRMPTGKPSFSPLSA